MNVATEISRAALYASKCSTVISSISRALPSQNALSRSRRYVFEHFFGASMLPVEGCDSRTPR